MDYCFPFSQTSLEDSKGDLPGIPLTHRTAEYQLINRLSSSWEAEEHSGLHLQTNWLRGQENDHRKEQKLSGWSLRKGPYVAHAFQMEMKLKLYKNCNEICQHVCGGRAPTGLVTESLHAVATVKYIFPKQCRIGQAR